MGSVRRIGEMGPEETCRVFGASVLACAIALTARARARAENRLGNDRRTGELHSDSTRCRSVHYSVSEIGIPQCISIRL